MTQGFRVLIISEQASIREFHVSRTRLWVSSVAVLVAIGIAVAVGFALGRLSPQWSRSARAVGPRLARGLVSRANRLAEAALRPSHADSTGCGPEMVLVEGAYCPKLVQRCRTQTDPEGSALYGHRCAEYKRSSFCLSPQKQHRRFCIDRDEHAEVGTTLPQSRVTVAEARANCERQGKRLCSNAEWTFACEGEEANPYPYGVVRDATVCNIDRAGLVSASGELNDLRSTRGTFPRCQSAFGVRDLSGNVEEYVLDDATGQPLRKGGYWQPGANHCRASQPHADQNYRGIELGYRCCADVPAGHA